jgi:putative membrane protein
MNIAHTIPLADSWGMHSGGGWWWILMVPMMVFMGAMMWMMMRGMGGGSSPDSSAPSESPITTESPSDILDRRVAEGEISIEDYQARREALASETVEPSGDYDEEPLTAPRA